MFSSRGCLLQRALDRRNKLKTPRRAYFFFEMSFNEGSSFMNSTRASQEHAAEECDEDLELELFGQAYT